MRRLIAGLTTALLPLALGTLMSTGSAVEHTTLESMTPAVDSSVPAPPATVVLRFNEEIEPAGAQVQIKAPSGADVGIGAIEVLGNTVTRPVGPTIEIGRYRVDARIVSADGHPTVVSVGFTVTGSGHASTPRPAASLPPEKSWPNAVLIGLMILLALFLVVRTITLIRRRSAAST